MNKEELFREIAKELHSKEIISIPSDNPSKLSLVDKFHDNHLDILRILIYGVENDEAKQTLYTKIKRHFKI